MDRATKRGTLLKSLNADLRLHMTSTDPTPPDFGTSEIPPETFCIYLAKQFIAQKGFELASVPKFKNSPPSATSFSPNRMDIHSPSFA